MDFLSEEHLEELRKAHEKSPPSPPSAATLALTVLVLALLLGMIAFIISDHPLPRNLEPAIKKANPASKVETSPAAGDSTGSTSSTVPTKP